MELKEAPRDIVPPREIEEAKVFVPCDECRAKSWYFVTIKGSELSFCGHHATKYEVALLSKADEPPRDLRYLI